jgi:hypothetical protein
MGMRRGSVSLARLINFPARSWRYKPDVMITWRYHADALRLVTRGLLHVPKLVWNFRASELEADCYRGLNKLVRNGHSLVSEMPDAGEVVASGDVHSLAAAWRRLVEMPGPERQHLGQVARIHIWADIALQLTVAQYRLVCLAVYGRGRIGVQGREWFP